MFDGELFCLVPLYIDRERNTLHELSLCRVTSKRYLWWSRMLELYDYRCVHGMHVFEEPSLYRAANSTWDKPL